MISTGTFSTVAFRLILSSAGARDSIQRLVAQRIPGEISFCSALVQWFILYDRKDGIVSGKIELATKILDSEGKCYPPTFLCMSE